MVTLLYIYRKKTTMKILAVIFSIVFTQSCFSQNEIYKNLSRADLENLATKMAFLIDTMNNKINALNNEIKRLDSCSYAKKKDAFCEALNNDSITNIKSGWDFYDFKVISCKGNRTAQEVELIILAEQSHLNQKTSLDLMRSTVLDGLGKSLKFKLGNYGPGTIFTNTPTQISMTITGVIPGTEKLGLVGLKMSSKDVNQTGHSDYRRITEFRNIPIVW